MASFCYRIRTTQKNKLVKVQILFTVGRGNQFYADSGYVVLSDVWNNKTQALKSRFAYDDDFTEQQGRELLKNLADMRSHILGEIANDPDLAMTKQRLERIIYAFHNPKSERSYTSKKSKTTLSDYILKFVREIESGERLNNQKLRYTPSTVKNYKGFITQFEEFCKSKRKRFDFGDIDLTFYDDFVAFFSKKDYSINTIGRHVKDYCMVK